MPKNSLELTYILQPELCRKSNWRSNAGCKCLRAAKKGNQHTAMNQHRKSGNLESATSNNGSEEAEWILEITSRNRSTEWCRNPQTEKNWYPGQTDCELWDGGYWSRSESTRSVNNGRGKSRAELELSQEVQASILCCSIDSHPDAKGGSFCLRAHGLKPKAGLEAAKYSKAVDS